MKSLVAAAVLLSILSVPAQRFVEEPVRPEATPRSSVDFGTELAAVTAQVEAQVASGKTTEADFKETLATINALIVKYLHNGNREQLAQLYLLDAHIYADGVKNTAKASAIRTQIIRDFPTTKAAQSARIDLENAVVHSAFTNASGQMESHENIYSEAAATRAARDEAKNSVLQWMLQTTVVAYDKFGDHKAQWDDSVRQALIAYAKFRARISPSQEGELITSNVQASVLAGCNDPLISYLYIRFVPPQEASIDSTLGISSNRLVTALCKSARALNQSSYPPIDKFYVSSLAAEYLNRSNVKPHYTQPADEARIFIETAASNLVTALSDPAMPDQAIYNDCGSFFRDLYQDSSELTKSYYLIEPVLFKNHPRYVGLLVRSWFHLNVAWQARGDGFADKVTARGWKDFALHVGLAETALTEAWELNPKEPAIPTTMITVELCQGQGRPRMETWFSRAMALNPDNVDACNEKCNYLQPKWYGSRREAIAFCRECLNSTVWGGRVPLTLANEYALELAEQKDRKLPETLKSTNENLAWDEVRLAYGKYFTNYPNDTFERRNYINLASHAQHWEVVGEQMPLVLYARSVDVFGQRWVLNQVAKAPIFRDQKIPPPQIHPVVLQVNRSVQVGESVSFNTDVATIWVNHGSENLQRAPCAYQWRLNGTNITGATNATFTIEHAAIQDTGEYTVVVTNPGGITTSPADRLAVFDPAAPSKLRRPIIELQPHGQNVSVGDKVKLMVVVALSFRDHSPLGYQWRLNGKDLSNTTNSLATLSNLAPPRKVISFTINSVRPDDAGTYSVIVTNSAGSVISSDAVLTVTTP